MPYLDLLVKKHMTLEVNIIRAQHTHLVFVMENSRMTAVQDHVITQALNILELDPMEFLIIHCIHDRRMAPSSKPQDQAPTLQSIQAQLLTTETQHTFLELDTETREQTILQVQLQPYLKWLGTLPEEPYFIVIFIPLLNVGLFI